MYTEINLGKTEALIDNLATTHSISFLNEEVSLKIIELRTDHCKLYPSFSSLSVDIAGELHDTAHCNSLYLKSNSSSIFFYRTVSIILLVISVSDVPLATMELSGGCQMTVSHVLVL